MKLSRKNRVFPLSLALVSVLTWAQCGSGTITGNTPSNNSNLPDPTAAVASQVGSTNQQVVEDVIHFERNLASGSDYDFEHVLEDLGAPKDNATNFAVDDGNEPIDTTFQYNESENCALGGTKTLVGELRVRLESGSNEGSISGTYFIVYDSCVENVHVSTSTEPCDVETQIGGTVTNAINIEFIDINSEDFERDKYITTNSVTANALEFSINEGVTRTVDFSFDVLDNSQFTDPDVSGTISFASQNYDVNDMANFIAETAAASVCP